MPRYRLRRFLFFTSIFFILSIVYFADGAFAAEQTTRDVGFVNKYVINTDENSFEVSFTANFLISSHNFNASDKTLQFDVETGLEEDNIGEIIIPIYISIFIFTI